MSSSILTLVRGVFSERVMLGPPPIETPNIVVSLIFLILQRHLESQSDMVVFQLS